jgi:hypothetical protein
VERAIAAGALPPTVQEPVRISPPEPDRLTFIGDWAMRYHEHW